jgi:hypothetical protein
MLPEKPQHPIQKDSIPGDEEKQRAWREAKLRELIENQTPSEIMESMTGSAFEKFGIDGIDGTEAGNQKSRNKTAKKDVQPQRLAPAEIEQLSEAIKEDVYLLAEQGLVFTRKQLASQLGIIPAALNDMTEDGFSRLGLVKIVPSKKRQNQ